MILETANKYKNTNRTKLENPEFMHEILNEVRENILTIKNKNHPSQQSTHRDFDSSDDTSDSNTPSIYDDIPGFVDDANDMFKRIKNKVETSILYDLQKIINDKEDIYYDGKLYQYNKELAITIANIIINNDYNGNFKELYARESKRLLKNEKDKKADELKKICERNRQEQRKSEQRKREQELETQERRMLMTKKEIRAELKNLKTRVNQLKKEIKKGYKFWQSTDEVDFIIDNALNDILNGYDEFTRPTNDEIMEELEKFAERAKAH